MIDVVAVNFKDNGRLYYFSYDGINLDVGNEVIVCHLLLKQ